MTPFSWHGGFSSPRSRRATRFPRHFRRATMPRRHNWRSAGYFGASKMAFARTILALVTALSVAVLPATGGAAVNAKSSDAEMIAARSTDDCCPDNRCDKPARDCGSIAACALHCFSFVGGQASFLVYPRSVGRIVPILESV